MKNLNIFLFEWKHLLRSPFKIIALLLFIIAAIYGLHNGNDLYKKQISQIEKIQENIQKEKSETLALYEKGEKGPKARPWVDLTTPFWAIWYVPTYQFKNPSPAMVYSIGKTEQYGFYKKISPFASPYDADMAEEIANPERLQIGTLDFAFTLLFLLPLLLLILVYNIKSTEAEQGFLPLIEVQTTSKNYWLLSRMAFYTVLSAFTIIALLLYGATLTNVFETASDVFSKIMLYAILYLIFWSVIYFFILKSGKRILGNTLKMIGVWLLFAFIIPATVHQVVSIKKPSNLMTELIDADRDKKQELYDQPDSIFQKKLNIIYPFIEKSPVYLDSTKRASAMNRSASALINQLKKQSIKVIEIDSKEKNNMIKNTFWFNPVSFFQNKLNSFSGTHYDNYQAYRDTIQHSIDKRIDLLISDLWNDVMVDKTKFLEYNTILE